MTRGRFINYAHRGASSYAPENTFASFYLGLSLGANGIETDIQTTKDGVFVLHHDDTLSRICSIDKAVSELTLKELRELDFGSFFSTDFLNERIVTLEDFLTYFSGKSVTFALEIKQEGSEYEVYEFCKKYLSPKQYFITSFSFEAVMNLASLDEPPHLGFLSTCFSLEIIDKLIHAGVEQYCPYAPSLTETDMDYLRAKGFNIRAWGIENDEIMRYAYNLGVDGMTVNFPDKLNELMLREPRPDNLH